MQAENKVVSYTVFVWVSLDKLKILIISFMFAFVLNPVGLNAVTLDVNPFSFKFNITFSNFGGDVFILLELIPPLPPPVTRVTEKQNSVPYYF